MGEASPLSTEEDFDLEGIGMEIYNKVLYIPGTEKKHKEISLLETMC